MQYRPHRGRWVTAAAVILVAFGVLAILYAVTDGRLHVAIPNRGHPSWPLAVLNLAAGIGLFRLHGWARIVAGLLRSCCSCMHPR